MNHNDQIETLNEKIGLEQDGLLYNEHGEESMKFKNPFEDAPDQEEPMTIERKIHMLGKIFPLAINDRVRNLLSEDGIVEMVGLDDRGVLYLIKYKDQKTKWESEHSIKKNDSYKSSQEDSTLDKSSIKTDIEE